MNFDFRRNNNNIYYYDKTRACDFRLYHLRRISIFYRNGTLNTADVNAKSSYEKSTILYCIYYLYSWRFEILAITCKERSFLRIIYFTQKRERTRKGSYTLHVYGLYSAIIVQRIKVKGEYEYYLFCSILNKLSTPSRYIHGNVSYAFSVYNGLCADSCITYNYYI